MEKIFIVGSGFMGTGMAQNAILRGMKATLYDVSEAQLEKSRESLVRELEKQVSRGRLTEEEYHEAMDRVSYVTDISACSDADIVIEAASENKDIKIGIMKEIDKYASDDAIITSNTSSISITTLGSYLKNPHRFVGTHFFSPVPRMSLMEVVKGMQTDTETLKKATEFGEAMGKNCILAKDEAGFIVNRMLLPMLNEACFLVERKVGSIEEIDRGMKKGLNHPMGPLELMDMIGIDVELAVMEVIYSETGDSKYRPAVTLRRMVDAGFLGRKSGAGFYVYNDDGTKEPNPEIIAYSLGSMAE